MKRLPSRLLAQPPYNPDIPILLVGVPLIAAFNYVLTYRDIEMDGFLLLTFSIDVIQGYVGVFAVRRLILRLDRQFPYSGGITRRLLLQSPAVVTVGVGTIVLLTEGVSLAVRGHFVPRGFYTTAVPLIAVWFMVVNVLYVVLHFYGRWQQSEASRKRISEVVTGGIIVPKRDGKIQLGFADLLACRVSGDYVECFARSGQRYLLEESLIRLYDRLPGQCFFRANRQVILNRTLIAGFERGGNGKLHVLVPSSPLPERVTVSRARAAEFRRWFGWQEAVSSPEDS